jgi:hypothetical protein
MTLFVFLLSLATSFFFSLAFSTRDSSTKIFIVALASSCSFEKHLRIIGKMRYFSMKKESLRKNSFLLQ